MKVFDFDSTENIEKIQTRDEFIHFVAQLGLDLRNHPEQWANKSLEDYLDAVSAWVGDMDGAFRNQGLPVPQNVPWKVLAHILSAAKYYS
ncbi:MAG: hypothetical protein K1X70_09705 [Leptospirales bacterium]|nr:hypothetical protein [Leptospirales bacterium]